MEAEAVLAAYRSSRSLLATLAGLNVLTVAGTAFLIAADGGWNGTWLTTAAGAYAVASLLLSWATLRVSGRSLVIHPGWFEYRTPVEGFRARWDQVEAVYATPSGIHGRRRPFGRYEYRLLICGRRVDAGTAVGADAALGQILAERTLPHLYQRAVAHLRSGRPVRFGPVTLGPDALLVRTLPARRLDLDHLDGCALQRGRLALGLKGKSRRLLVPAGRVPNARVLLRLLENRGDWQRAAGRPRGQRPNSARTKNQKLAGRSAMRRVR